MIREYKTMIFNFGYLSILQILMLLLPLATYPYLIRVLGPGLYGEIIYAQAFISYFSIFINYGFNISATKDISIHRNDKDKLTEIFSSVFIIKFTIWILCFAFLLLFITLSPYFNHNKILYLLSFGSCFNELLFQQFFFQGLEKMKYITFINVISRLFFFFLIFILVKTSQDYLYVPLLNSLGALLGGILAFYIIVHSENISFKWQSKLNLKRYFYESTPFFLSRFSGVVVNKTNTILIGSYIGYVEVSYYDLAQKILSVLLIPFDMLNQVIYPNVVKTKNMEFMKKIIRIVICLSIVMYILLFFGKNIIIDVLAGNDMLAASLVVQILCFNVITTSVNYFLGNTVLVVMGHAKDFNMSVIYGGIGYIIINTILLLSGYISIYTLAFSALLIECLTLFYRFIKVKSYNLLTTI